MKNMIKRLAFPLLVIALGSALVLALMIGLARAESGIASYYDCCQTTANGEAFKTSLLTAAHKTLPFGTCVEVKNKNNGRKVVVRINDRGPFIRGRVIDLTPAAKNKIGMGGTAPVTLTVVGKNRC